MSCVHGYENPDYCDKCNAESRMAELQEERAAWRALAAALIEAGGEDGRYVAICQQEAWASAVAAVRSTALIGTERGRPNG